MGLQMGKMGKSYRVIIPMKIIKGFWESYGYDNKADLDKPFR